MADLDLYHLFGLSAPPADIRPCSVRMMPDQPLETLAGRYCRHPRPCFCLGRSAAWPALTSDSVPAPISPPGWRPAA